MDSQPKHLPGEEGTVARSPADDLIDIPQDAAVEEEEEDDEEEEEEEQEEQRSLLPRRRRLSFASP